ncbi:MAG: 3-hydroxybutyryl-CoA dehydrogenase [Candidatus Nanopelagicales bacterium]
MGQISKVGVVGLGTMGAGIVEVLARAGVEVIGVEVSEEKLAKGRGRLDKSLARAVERGKLTEDDRTALLARVRLTTDIAEVADRELAIEAVTEALEVKRTVLADLDRLLVPEAIIATNTSSLSVTELSVATGRPDRVVGMHFFNPAPVLSFMEIVRTVVTSQEVVDQAVEFAEQVGRTPVVVGDRAGFIANALLFGYLNHAANMYEARYASREDIDAAMRLGCGYPMGPLALLDLIGLDTAYRILDTMYKESRDRLHAPAPILKQMVTAGMQGRKSGRGFYSYQAPGSSAVVADALTPAADGALGAGRTVEKVGVVGSGTMATGIMEVFIKSGYDTIYVARTDERVAQVRAALERSLAKAVQRGKLTEEAQTQALARVSGTTSLDDLADVDLVVEAVVEEIGVKTTLFANLDEICKPGAVLATTTSSLPVVEMAAVTERPDDVVGMHFFNPAAIMKLVEIVAHVSTSPEVLATAAEVCKKTGKHAVHCGDRAGFIVNALLFPYLNDAVRMLEAHYATADEIDLAMKMGAALPMGPFALLDVVGNDVSLAIQQTLYREFREPGFAPAPMLEHMVTAGYLGRKTGRGFRSYAK